MVPLFLLSISLAMQGNGFKIFAIVAFLLLSLWYLFPTLQHRMNERELAAMDSTERARYQEANYEDLQSTRERALKLGLDLQGGMHVTLEVGMDALLRGLAEGRTDDVFDRAIQLANERARTRREEYVDLFVEAIQEQAPNTRLSRYFRNPGEGISARSENAEVVEYLRREASAAIDRAVEIIRQRVDRFGVTEPSIQKQGSRRIVVEMPGVTDAQRVRDLLRGTARLEFRLMADPAELQSSYSRISAHLSGTPVDTSATAAPADTAAADTAGADTARRDTGAATDVRSLTAPETQAPAPTTGVTFAEVVRPSPYPEASVIFGVVSERDTAAANRLLRRRDVQALLPPGITLMYTANPDATTDQDEESAYFLLGVRARAELTGEVLTNAGPSFDPITNEPKVSLEMNSEGAQRWSQITGANIGRQVAVVLDNVVYTYPNIQERIPNGRTEISGVSRTEQEDVVNILKAGALPAPVQIIEERTVGPSLGAASIRAGTISFLIGFLVVALFTIAYYRWAGAIAVLALALNVLFLFGILAAFGATLTLPGIAGIVLTIGMAIDANVLIYERIREELGAGKTLRASIEGGFSAALSAILDGNITTFFVGVILYSFGVGQIQGFAVTLMAGIVTSLFAALVVTRLLLQWLVVDRRVSVDFG